MRIIGVIPARFGSTRFEGKPLKLISGKPLLHWVIEGSKKSKLLSEIIVATDDERVAECAKQQGVRVVMTDSRLPSGSDRVWAVVKNENCDAVINIQGDEPLITGDELDTLAKALLLGGYPLVTLARHFKEINEVINPSTAKIVVNKFSEAIYFSRLPIPQSRVGATQVGVDGLTCLKHIGLYGFEKEFLKTFCEQKPTALELAEGLEQLRALWLGAKVKVILTDYESWGVDTPEDVIRIEEIIQSRRTR
jgi:3-deoxy-manno-octulosonate cytidylyltransferase (CMP-KDO synthetase)